MEKKNVFVLLPSGFGKNLVKHCSALCLAMGQQRASSVTPQTLSYLAQQAAKNLIGLL